MLALSTVTVALGTLLMLAVTGSVCVGERESARVRARKRERERKSHKRRRSGIHWNNTKQRTKKKSKKKNFVHALVMQGLVLYFGSDGAR